MKKICITIDSETIEKAKSYSLPISTFLRLASKQFNGLQINKQKYSEEEVVSMANKLNNFSICPIHKSSMLSSCGCSREELISFFRNQ